MVAIWYHISMIIIWLAVLLASFFVLAVLCDEFFVPSLEKISDRLKLAPDVAGATFMAVGSSAPEFFTSLLAVLLPSGHSEVGAGTIVGSAIFNILVIIGASATFRHAHLNWQPVIRDIGFYCISIILLLISFWDGRITLPEAGSFVAVYALYIWAVTKWRTWFPYVERNEDPLELLEEETEQHPVLLRIRAGLSFIVPDVHKHPDRYLWTFGISIGLIGLLSFAMVESAIHVATTIGIPPAIVALTVVAAGTSVPDLLASMAVAKQGRGDMAISNAVGSNIFDILIGLGLPWAIGLLVYGKHIQVGTENLLSSVFLLFATVIAVFFVMVLRKWSIGPKAGWLLIGLYLLYLGHNVLAVMGVY